MITSTTTGVWELDDVYAKVNAERWRPSITALFTWGNNGAGRLGLNDVTPRSSPVQIPGLQWNQISSGNVASVATKTDGTLWSWGGNSSGELGQNNRANSSSPIQIPGTQWNNISAGINLVLATKTDGTLWGWGNNGGGELGKNDVENRSSPVQIPGTQWNKVSGGNVFSLATKTDGTLWSWGSNYFGRLGLNSAVYRSSPVQIPGTQWNIISAGGVIGWATKTDGTLWGWGRGDIGTLGQNSVINRSSPTQVPGTQWNSVSPSFFTQYPTVIATKTDGTLWSWGGNSIGELGQNNITYYSSPQQIPGTQWNSVSMSGNVVIASSALASKTDGTLWSWGYNSSGQLGLNDRIHYSSPIQIPGIQWSNPDSGASFSTASKSTYI